jgi:hypothetical protein
VKPVSPGPARPCPRCGKGYTAVLSPERLEVLASESPIPASLRAGESVLRRRLACCSTCGGLREQVLCARCGCFVRFRAAVLKSRCPSPAGDKWAAVSGPSAEAGGHALGEKALHIRSIT